MRRAALVAILISVTFSVQVEAKTHTIRTNKAAVTRIGSFNTNYANRRVNPTIAKAIRAFGRPSSIFPVTAGEGCAVKWKRFRLRIEFYNFGVADSDASDCEPNVGLAQHFTVEGRKFRTWRGLRVGMSEERVWDLHPNAGWIEDDDYYPDGFWLRENYSRIGDGGNYPVAAAYLRDGSVSSLSGWIGAAGE